MRARSAGIDFGTSNSTVGFVEAGAPALVALEGAHVTMPTAVFFNFEDGRTQFGRDAIGTYTEHVEGRLLRALKSVLGSSLMHEKTRIKARQIAFTDIIGFFLAHLKSRLDTAAGGEISSVVLGRPVHFVDEDAAADRAAQDELERAARRQGFAQIDFQYEPIAAALDYERQVRAEELALIADIGGGTSDFSIVRVSPERARAADRRDDILANAGVHVGGTDFDRLLSLARVMPALGHGTPTKDGKRNLPAAYYVDLATWQRINMLYTQKTGLELRQVRYEASRPELVDRLIEVVSHRLGHALAQQVEGAKIALTDSGSAALTLDVAGKPEIGFTRAALDEAIDYPVSRIASTLTETVRQAGVPAGSISTLFLTGGSTAIPAVRAALLGAFPNARVVEGDKFGSVGLGLALDAARKFGA